MKEPTEQLLDEHHGCMRLASEVEAALQSEHREGWTPALAETLKALRARLESHFKREESGYLYHRVPLLYPRFAERLDRLRAEHGPLLQAFDEVNLRAQRACEPENTVSLADLGRRIRAVVAWLRRHEAEENEVLLCAHWDDVGGPGD